MSFGKYFYPFAFGYFILGGFLNAIFEKDLFTMVHIIVGLFISILVGLLLSYFERGFKKNE